MSMPTVSRKMERGILGLFAAAATVVALAFVIVPATRQVIEIITGQTWVSLLTSAEVPHDLAETGPMIVSASFDSAWVAATGLSDGTRWLLSLGVGFGALTAAVTTGAIVYFLFLLMWKRPFHRSLVVATQIAGSALLIGGILSSGLGGFGKMFAATELNPLANDVFTVGFAVEIAPIALAGVAVLALSYVFDRGMRLQRDTEGLV